MCRVGKCIRVVLKLLVFVVFGMLFIILRYILRTPQALSSVLPGDAHLYKWSHGHIFYKELGPIDAQPLVILHMPEIGASSYEMRHIIESLALHFHVYTLDLPGFGLSAHPRITYSADTYVSLGQDFLREIVTRPATLLASGLSCNYSIAIAAREPDMCKRVILLSPVGLSGEPQTGRWLAQLSAFPVSGLLIYALLTSRIALRRSLAKQHTLQYQYVSTGEIDYIFACAHQVGAHYAALAYLAGKLCLDVSQLLRQLQQPTLVIWGGREFPVPPSIAEQCRASALKQLTVLHDAGIRVQEESPAQVVDSIVAWQTPEIVPEVSTPASAVPSPAQPMQLSSEGIAVEPREGPENVVEMKQIEAYCVKCRKKQPMVQARKVITKNGRKALEGACPVCSTKLFRFISA